ncbi:MAG: SIS domain-containing protein [Thiobacillaceae bacterium]
MDLTDHLQQQLTDAIAVQEAVLEGMVEPLVLAVERLLRCLMADGKILACGNGAGAALAQLFAASLVHRFEAERPGLAALSLTADAAITSGIANSAGQDRVYARQIEALGAPGDLLLLVSDDGEDASLLAALEAAQDKDLGVIALTGHDGGRLAEALREEDILLCVPAHTPARIHEAQLLVLDGLCEGIDFSLLGA